MKSLRQFATLAGVSPSTVSRVFSNNELVAQDTRAHILRLADEHGFRPSAVYRASFGGRTNSVGILLPDLRVSFFADIAVGLQQELLKADVLPVNVQSGLDDERLGIRRLIDHRVDALILNLIDEQLNHDDFGEIIRAEMPMLLLGTVEAGLKGDKVDSDDITGGRLAGEHLIGLGHTQFGFCYYGQGHSTCDRRLQGFEEALAEAGLSLLPANIARIPISGDETALAEEIRHILQAPQRPTAFFAATDFLALAVYRVSFALGLRIPEDLSVVGYADLNFASYVTPPLTTVRQDGIEIGRLAGRLVLERLAANTDEYRHVEVPTTLTVRRSTGPRAAG